VPLQNLFAPQTDKLRNEILLKAVNHTSQGLLGEVQLPPWWTWSVTLAKDPRHFGYEVGLELRIDPYSVSIRSPKDFTSYEFQEGHRVGVRQTISDYDLMGPSRIEGNPDLIALEIIASVVEGLMMGMSSRLYEHDPRIGFSPYNGQLQNSPLLDPPGPFNRDPFGMNHLNAILDDDEDPIPTCPFCNQKLDHPFNTMWAGGNLLWTHPDCWRNS
jgi:hypothetical protein